ncbi:MAG: NYN domain-containing protein [Pseudomonadota bacterium]
MPTAIVIDGAFFLRRFSRSFPDLDAKTPGDIALGLKLLANWHLALRLGPDGLMHDPGGRPLPAIETAHLYRIFFYDCPPLTKRMHRPVSGTSIDLAKTPDAKFRLAVHKELQNVRKVALRLGRLNDTSLWRLGASATQRFIGSRTAFTARDEDFEIDIKQKGVDMRLGLDVASMAFKRQVDQIVIVAADADFVPAAKLARREGIDVVLDRMGDQRAAKDLVEHVDGIRDCFLPHPAAR